MEDRAVDEIDIALGGIERDASGPDMERASDHIGKLEFLMPVPGDAHDIEVVVEEGSRELGSPVFELLLAALVGLICRYLKHWR